MTEGLQSGDDSGLKNIWDEICVQMQTEQSVMWEAYEDIILSLLEQEVRGLNDAIIGAIWLQTDESEDWANEIQDRIDEGEIKEWDQETVDYSLDDVTRHIMKKYVLKQASDYTNKRIEKCIDDGYSL